MKARRTSPDKSKEMQDNLVQGLIKGNTQKDAGLAAGYTDEGNISRAVKRARRRFSEVLDSIGYDDTLAARKIDETADRKKTEFLSDKGVVIEEKEVEDNGVQLAARRFLAECHGAKAEIE